MIVQCATFFKSLNPRNIDKSVSYMRMHIRFPFQSSFLYPYPVANSLSFSVVHDPVSGLRFNRILQFRTGSESDWI